MTATPIRQRDSSIHSPVAARPYNIRLLAPSYQRRFKVVMDSFDPTGKILDLGCADGFYSKNIANSNNQVFGVDRNLAFLDETWLGTNPTFIESDAQALSFKDAFFDTVICVDMLEHVDNDKAVLEEIYRVLKPGGRLVISVPNYNYPFTYDPVNYVLKHFNRHVPIGIWGFGHKRIYSCEALADDLRRAGFRVDNTRFLTHTFAALFENYLSTIFQRTARREKTKHGLKPHSVAKRRLLNFGFAVTRRINSIDARILTNSRTSIGFVISATKNESD